VKALYKLRTSGLHWHEQFVDTLCGMGFVPSHADPDVWMQAKNGVYEYIAVYVNDLCIAARDPKAIIDELIEKHRYKLKHAGPLEFHLGCDFFHDPDGTLCFGQIKYIKKILSVYKNMFNQKPKPSSSPLERNDPELDASEEVAADVITQYQSMIGALQWTISLGRFDICTAIMTLSCFHIAP